MPVHHGRHELPGWRGYLPDSVDRAARRGSDRRSAALRSPASRRLVAVGTLAACAMAGGVVIHTRSAGPPDALPGPADDVASALAGSSAWMREATPVLASLETEIRRTDEVRWRWDASSLARRDGSTPVAVVALLERRSELMQHRDALRAAVGAVRSAPASESALLSAWPQLRAAQEMLGALVSRRGPLGDHLETMVLSLILDEYTSSASVADQPPGRDARRTASDRVEDTVTVALTAPTSEPAVRSGASTAAPAQGPRTVAAAPERTAAVASLTRSAFGAAVLPMRSDSAEADDAVENPGSDTPFLAVAEPDGSHTDGGDQEPPEEGFPLPGSSPSSEPVPVVPSDATMLTFDRPSPGAADPESVSVGEDGRSLAADIALDADTGEETSNCPDRPAE
jgi:hypothetical protein